MPYISYGGVGEAETCIPPLSRIEILLRFRKLFFFAGFFFNLIGEETVKFTV